MISNVFLSGYGEAPIAAMGIALKCNMLMIMLYMGLSMGSQPLIGYTYGAGNFTRMKGTVKYIVGVGICIGVAGTTLFMCCAEPIVSIFISDSEVVSYGTTMLKILSSTAVPLGFIFVSTAILQAMGKAMPSLFLSVCRQGLVFIPVAYLTNTFLGLDGLMWAQPISDTVSVIVAILLLLFTLKHLTPVAEPA